MKIRRRRMGWAMGAAALVSAGLWMYRATGYTGCAGDQTNSAVVAEWLFNEGTGATAFNTGTSGDAGNLTFLDGASFSSDVPPVNGGCGWSLALPYTNVTAVTPGLKSNYNYRPLEGAGQFTVMAWVKRESPTANDNREACIVSVSQMRRRLGMDLGFDGSEDVLRLRVNRGNFVASTGEILPNEGNWHHVAATYNSALPGTNALTKHVYFYVDGVQVNAGGMMGSQNEKVDWTADPLRIGHDSYLPTMAARKFAGKIEDVRILWGWAPAAVGLGNTNAEILCYRNRSDDFDPPVMTGLSDVTVEITRCQGGVTTNVDLGTPEVSDNCGGAVTVTNDAPVEFSWGARGVVWTATDAAGNRASSTQTVTVVYSLTSDCDGDGLTDEDEVNVYGTDPTRTDTDGDGMPDGWEVAHGLNPLVNDAGGDLDGDGLSNLWEYQAGTDLQNADTDGDGMPDGWEVAHGLDPLGNDADGDLDGDGVTNLREYLQGRNPNSPIDLVVFTPRER